MDSVVPPVAAGDEWPQEPDGFQDLKFGATKEKIDKLITLGWYGVIPEPGFGRDDPYPTCGVVRIDFAGADVTESLIFAPTGAAVPTSTLPTVSPASAPANGLLNIAFTSTPANALVTIGGMALGRTPFTTKLPPGFYKATFSVAGFTNSIENMTVGAGYPTSVNATLQASGGQ